MLRLEVGIALVRLIKYRINPSPATRSLDQAASTYVVCRYLAITPCDKPPRPAMSRVRMPAADRCLQFHPEYHPLGGEGGRWGRAWLRVLPYRWVRACNGGHTDGLEPRCFCLPHGDAGVGGFSPLCSEGSGRRTPWIVCRSRNPRSFLLAFGTVNYRADLSLWGPREVAHDQGRAGVSTCCACSCHMQLGPLRGGFARRGRAQRTEVMCISQLAGWREKKNLWIVRRAVLLKVAVVGGAGE